MKKIYFLFMAMISLSFAFSQDLVISGVFDGQPSWASNPHFPKGVELYVLNDIADLSTYGIGSANNGGGTDGEEFTFPAISVTAGTYIYIASDSSGFYDFFGFSANYINSAASINGDDAIELFSGGSVIDVFAEIDCDPNSSGSTCPQWEYLDGWAYRVDATGPDGTTPVEANWTFSGVDELQGAVDNASSSTPFPIGTYSMTPPPATDIRFKMGSVTVNEDAGAGVILDSIVWGFAATGTEQIEIHIISGNTADEGADFQFPNAMTTFPVTLPFALAAGETALAFPLDILEDVISEGTENVKFVIRNVTGFTLGNDSILSIDIIDNDFTVSDIEDVTVVDATGTPVSLGAQVILTGVVNSKDRGFNNLEFSIQDLTGGITVVSDDAAFQSIDPQVGDQYKVTGVISLYNGVVSIEELISLTNLTSGMTVTPTVETMPTDDNESSLIRINGLEIIEPSTWVASGGAGFTVQALNPTGDTINIRIDRDYDALYNSSAPNSPIIDVIGVASQYDPSSPYDDNYQIIPRELNDIILYPAINMNEQAASVNEDAGTVTIDFTVANYVSGSYTVDVVLTSGDVADINNFATMTAVAVDNGTGSITVDITDDTEVESNEVFVFELSNASTGLLLGNAKTFELTINDNDADAIENIKVNALNIYPNPTSDIVNIEMYSNENQLVNISVIDLSGKKVLENIFTLNNGKNILEIDLSKLSIGNYIINMSTEKGSHSDTLMVK